jgi:hypothetical protein
MFDTSNLIDPLINNFLAKPQLLPAPPSQDVMKFDSVFSQRKSLEDVATVDTGILQLKGTDNSNTGNLTDSAMSKIVDIDGSYQKLMSEFFNRPQLKDFLPDQASAGRNDMRTYPHVDGSKDVAGRYMELAEKNRQHNEAAIKYADVITLRNIKSQMWFSNMKIISSAVKQVSEGFKTLFRAAG